MNRGRTPNLRGYYSPSRRGRSSRRGGNSSARCYRPVQADGPSDYVPSGQKDGLPRMEMQTSSKVSTDNNSKHVDCTSTSDYIYQQDCTPPSVKDISSGIGNIKMVQNSPNVVGLSAEQPEHLSASGSEFEEDFISSGNKDMNVRRSPTGQTSDSGPESHSSADFCCSSVVDTAHLQNASSLLAEPGIKDGPSKKGIQWGEISSEETDNNGRPDNSDCLPAPFDICPEKTGTGIKLKAPLLVTNREKRKEIKQSADRQNIRTLRSGMVLLKGYISCRDQVKIVKTCRDLGLGFGGFYQPGYRDGAKLHLKMMCLGKNWDPETGIYDDRRPIDGAKTPIIPGEFCQLVERAIHDSHAHLQKDIKGKNVESILPSVSPNICIVNFYTNSGRLGLHQDKDESEESLHRGLPVVSFSIGDSAEFLFGDQRDTDKADKILLESGDVLLFGGKSRHIFHGVSAIHRDTAPKALLEESNFRAGRLNLTFREY